MYTTVESIIYMCICLKSLLHTLTHWSPRIKIHRIFQIRLSYFCSIALTSYVINWELTMRRTGTFNFIDIITLKRTLIDQCNGKLRISQSVTLVFMIIWLVQNSRLRRERFYGYVWTNFDLNGTHQLPYVIYIQYMLRHFHNMLILWPDMM